MTGRGARRQRQRGRNGANNNCHESAGREIIGQAICAQQGVNSSSTDDK